LDVFEAIRGRRSVRAYMREEVSNDMIMDLIDAARWAPSAGNVQPWEFIVVRSKNVKHMLAEAALHQTFIEEASAVIVVCADEWRSARAYGLRGTQLYCIQDTAAATQNMLLAAYAKGLGTCWVGAFNEEKVSRVLSLPDRIRPVAIIPVGYPAEKPRPPRRRPLEDIVHYERFYR